MGILLTQEQENPLIPQYSLLCADHLLCKLTPFPPPFLCWEETLHKLRLGLQIGINSSQLCQTSVNSTLCDHNDITMTLQYS